jgi:hypothetical protein
VSFVQALKFPHTFASRDPQLLATLDLRVLFVEMFILITITGRKNHFPLPEKGAS